MMEPDERRFNPHNNVTSDGVIITEGLHVWTNEMEVGIVKVDQDVHEYGCCSREKCADWTTHHEEPGQMYIRDLNGWFSDHTAGGAACDEGCYCRHNHWFQVSTKNGIKAFDGERLATRSPNLGLGSAKEAWEKEHPSLESRFFQSKGWNH